MLLYCIPKQSTVTVSDGVVFLKIKFNAFSYLFKTLNK